MLESLQTMTTTRIVDLLHVCSQSTFESFSAVLTCDKWGNGGWGIEAMDDEAMEDEALDDESMEDEAIEDEALDDEAINGGWGN